jgi:hypothetical protein
MYINMWDYIIGGFVISYYLSFCYAVAYVSYKEYQEERRQRILEYEELSRENPGIEMFFESEYANRRGRLDPISEEITEKVSDIV